MTGASGGAPGRPLVERRPDARLALIGGTLWDPVTATVMPRSAVVVRGQRIVSVGAADDVMLDNDVHVIDCSGATVLPGLIDAHVHLTTNSTEAVVPSAQYRAMTAPAHKLLDGVRNATKALAAGVTTMRVVGHRDAGETELRDFIRRGHLPGPDLLVAPWWISMTAGHGDLFLPTAWPRRPWDTADGPDSCRQLVRLQVRHGADFIKVMASGGVLSHGDRPEWPNYTVAELRAIVDEAHSMDLRVAAHAHSVEGIRRSVEAGVDSIEHGVLADEATLELLSATGTALVPTLSITDWTAEEGQVRGVPQDQVDRMKDVRDQHFSMFQTALRLGVTIVMGTDSSGTICPFGFHARELELYTQLGMSTADALRTATSNAAVLLDRADKVGRLAPGHDADVLVVDGDVLTDISLLTRPDRIRTVLSKGRCVTEARPPSLLWDSVPGMRSTLARHTTSPQAVPATSDHRRYSCTS